MSDVIFSYISGLDVFWTFVKNKLLFFINVFAQNMIHNKTLAKNFALRYSLYSMNFGYYQIINASSVSHLRF